MLAVDHIYQIVSGKRRRVKEKKSTIGCSPASKMDYQQFKMDNIAEIESGCGVPPDEIDEYILLEDEEYENVP